MRKPLLIPGEPAPWFMARCTTNPDYHFDSVAGRYVVLCFFGSAADVRSRQILADFEKERGIFDDSNACFFGVSIDPEDESRQRVRELLPGLRFFWDFDKNVSRLFGAVLDEEETGKNTVYRPHTLILDERLRVMALLLFNDAPENHVQKVTEFLTRLPSIDDPGLARLQAPVLVVPRIFEPKLCRSLITYYDEHGGYDSGFMRQVDGKTVGVYDHGFKRRRDQDIKDEHLRKACTVRIRNRLAPEIYKAFQFQATHIERYIVACYDSTTGGFFRAHRDNTSTGTAHRRFAVSLNLNTGEYQGGELLFPEFGRQLYVAPLGGAVVFSCSLLHEATAVTHGRRYAFLPFLYDEASARIREENRKYVVAGNATAGD